VYRSKGFVAFARRGPSSLRFVSGLPAAGGTRQGGVHKVLPMKAHLAMDVPGGAMTVALPVRASRSAL